MQSYSMSELKTDENDAYMKSTIVKNDIRDMYSGINYTAKYNLFKRVRASLKRDK